MRRDKKKRTTGSPTEPAQGAAPASGLDPAAESGAASASGGTRPEVTFTGKASAQKKPTSGQLSVVIPTLGAAQRLRPTLLAVMRELELRGGRRDEVIVVDDSGDSVAESVVAEILSAAGEYKSAVRVIATKSNSGFGEAVREGVRVSKGELLLVLHDDVVLAEGALVPLLGGVAPDDVFAAAPVVRREGRAPETSAILALADDRFVVRDQGPGAVGSSGMDAADGEARDVTFMPSSVFATRRAKFLEVGGFDGLFAPFAFEDVDLSIRARRRGLRLVVVPAASAAHGGEPLRGRPVEEPVEEEAPRRAAYADDPADGAAPSGDDSIGSVPDELASAVVERNRLLLRWKHLQARAEATEHLVSLWRNVLEAGMNGDRETLQYVCMALDKLPEVTRARAGSTA